MTFFTETNIRNEAARIGFFNKSLKTLGDIVKNNIKETYKQDEKKLKLQSLQYGDKAMNHKNQKEHLESECKKSPIIPTEFSIGLLGIFLIIILAQTGKIVSGIMAPILVSLGFTGSLILRFHEVNKPNWRPILFTSLSIIGGIIVISSLLENENGVTPSLMAGLVTGVNIYILNSTIIDSSHYLINEAKKVFIIAKKFIHGCLFRFWKGKNNTANQSLTILQREIEIETYKITNIIELENVLGRTAREAKTMKAEKSIPQSIITEEFNYAN